MQAFKQAPWRKQIQNVGLFLLVLVIGLVIASIYLSISGRAATSGLNAYRMNLERETIEREIADRKATIAELTSSTVMEQRAKDMGFSRIKPSQAVYMIIPGYTGKKSVILAAPPGIDETKSSIVIAAYRESIWDWLFQGVNRLSAGVEGGQ
jgi:hypothetical protein